MARQSLTTALDGKGRATEPVRTQRRREKSLVIAGNQTPAVQPVAPRSTDKATLASNVEYN
jgi:hypothetical protein